MLRNSKMFFWDWGEIHLHFPNLPIKKQVKWGEAAKLSSELPEVFLCKLRGGEKRIIFMSRRNQLSHSFSSHALRKQRTKNRKKSPKMKCQLFRALLPPLQGHFSVTWLLFSRDNPGIKEKAAFPNRKQRKAGEFPFFFLIFFPPVLVAYLWARGQHVFHILDFCGINKYPFPRGRMGDDSTVESHSSQDVLTGFPWEGKGILKETLFPSSTLLSINPCWEFHVWRGLKLVRNWSIISWWIFFKQIVFKGK